MLNNFDELKKSIREINDFPIPGVLFRDITTLLKDGDLLKKTINKVAEIANEFHFDAILGPESRGFIFGMPLAFILGKGFVPIRKAGKLPAETCSKEYDLEYGTAKIEIHKDAVTKGMKFLLVDDLLATGGTAKASAELIKEMGGEITAHLFFIELSELGGRKTLENQTVRSVLVY